MRSTPLSLIGILLALTACASPGPSGPVNAADPRLGSADGNDAADRGCQVVLRSVRPALAADDTPSTECHEGQCFIALVATIDVDNDAVAADALPRVLFRDYEAGSWFASLTSRRVDGAPPGYQRFTLPVEVGGVRGLETAELEIVAYLDEADGGRLFDHNQHVGDLDNLRLSGATGFVFDAAEEVCAAPTLDPVGWVGDFVAKISRAGGPHCEGPESGPVQSELSYGTWARERAADGDLCFSVWSEGVTDFDNDELDTHVSATLVCTWAGETEPRRYPAMFDQRLGNNARYRLSLGGIDPLHHYRCPEMPVAREGDRDVVSAECGVEVNGASYGPGGEATSFQITYSDYADGPHRVEHCEVIRL